MTHTDTILRRTAFSWMSILGVFGGAFLIGETFADPGGWTAAALVASWLVPLLVLAWLGVARTETAQPVFILGALVVAVFTLADSAFGIVPRDDWGPVAAIAVFALGVALGFLGLRRATLAGALLLMLVVAQVAATLVEHTGEGGPRVSLGGSSGAVIVPLLVGGVMFLLAGRHPTELTPADDDAHRRTTTMGR